MYSNIKHKNHSLSTQFLENLEHILRIGTKVGLYPIRFRYENGLTERWSVITSSYFNSEYELVEIIFTTKLNKVSNRSEKARISQ